MPYRLDLFAIFIFLGIIQAVFLSVFFFSTENRKNQSNVFYGLMLLLMAACILEIFLMYTGYIIHCLHLVDFSEPLSLAIGPVFYLMVLSLIHGHIRKMNYVHFVFPVLYAIIFIPFLFHAEDIKYNSWIHAYRINLPFKPSDFAPGGWYAITKYHTELTIISLILYIALALIDTVKVFRSKKESFLTPVNPVLKKLRAGTLEVAIIVLLLIIIKLTNASDTGDHIVAAYIAVSIYVTSFRVIVQSGFFKSATLAEPQKYKTSSVTADQQQALLQKLIEVMKNERPYLKADFSLPDLAQQLGVSVHVLSQIINEGLNKTFFEMTAEYRVGEAKRLLKEKAHIKVEEIAEQVGYHSKSSFNTAFKRLTGKTPSEFRSKQ
jgi:AraC-like DNA-binding protein